MSAPLIEPLAAVPIKYCHSFGRNVTLRGTVIGKSGLSSPVGDCMFMFPQSLQMKANESIFRMDASSRTVSGVIVR